MIDTSEMMITQAIIAIIASWFIGEAIKTSRQILRKEKVRWLQDGGMPSTHSAIVSALALAAYFEEGRFTILVLVCIIFGWIIAHDAYNVRWEVTKHSHTLNKLLKTKDHKVAGHTFWQVAAGVVLGVLVTLIVYAI